MPDEEDLEELKEQRREELEDKEQQEEDRREQIKNLASQYLTSEAQSRLGNVRAADPETASAVESQIARLGRAGRIDEVDDDQLKDILREVRNGDDDDNDIKFRR